AVTARTRAIVFNSPNNPTGKVFSRGELQAIADLCLEHDLLAITDEIYEHIVYDGLGHTPIATLPGMAERTVTISGISKSYSVTGWRVGYAVAPPELAIGIRRAHDFVTVGAPHPLQEAAVTAFGLPESYYVELRESYQARRDLLWGYLEKAGLVAWKPRGAYYILTDGAHVLTQPDLPDDTAFATWLIQNVRLDARYRRVVVLGCGKASAAMAAAAEEVLGDRLAGGFVVVKDGCAVTVPRVEIAEAGHPVPDERGLAASARLLELAHAAGEESLVLFLVSGGGSALTPAPAPPITLAEKQEVTRLLLASGATIGELNAVRKHLSRFKGGQLARAAWPASVLTLALSDVIGDPLDVIASGPTAPDPTTFAGAREVLARRGLAGRVPASVAARLEAGLRGEIEETPKPGDRLF